MGYPPDTHHKLKSDKISFALKITLLLLIDQSVYYLHKARQWHCRVLRKMILRWISETIPDSKVHVDHMGPTWVLSAPGGPHVCPMNLAIRDPMLRPPPRLPPRISNNRPNIKSPFVRGTLPDAMSIWLAVFLYFVPTKCVLENYWVADEQMFY